MAQNMFTTGRKPRFFKKDHHEQSKATQNAELAKKNKQEMEDGLSKLYTELLREEREEIEKMDLVLVPENVELNELNKKMEELNHQFVFHDDETEKLDDEIIKLSKLYLRKDDPTVSEKKKMMKRWIW